MATLIILFSLLTLVILLMFAHRAKKTNTEKLTNLSLFLGILSALATTVSAVVTPISSGAESTQVFYLFISKHRYA